MTRHVMLDQVGESQRKPRRQPRRYRKPRLPNEGVTDAQPVTVDGRRVRPPGARLNITGDALRDTEDPAILRMLTPTQREERRTLRRNENARRRYERVKRLELIEHTSHQRCHERLSNGKLCKSYRVYGSDRCIHHISAEDRERLEIPELVKNRKGKRKHKAPEVMRQVVEAAVAKILEPYFTALGMEFVGYDEETQEPIIVHRGKGIMIHGESKDGDIIMTDYQNVAAQVAVAERLLDRVYGKPRQTQVIEGGSTPVRVAPVRTEERAREVADLLARSQAIPPHHNGRQRREAAHPTDASAHEPKSHE